MHLKTSDQGTSMDSTLNRANQLHGLSLADGFKRFVLNDPGVIALGKHVLAADKRYAAILHDGQAWEATDDFHWPLDLTASAIAYRFVASLLIIVGAPDPEPSSAILAVSEVLADRIARFRDLLASGEIVAFGTFVQSGLEVPIGRFQWTRGGISIDVSNGDLCEGQDYRAVPRWTGLSLRLPEAQLPLHQPQTGTASKVAALSFKAKAQIETKANCYLDCVAWLVGLMSDPATMPRSIDDLWAEVKLKWPNKVSRRAFLKAREEAISKAEALAWKAPGPKAKSPHS
jgi:hypothetical protein